MSEKKICSSCKEPIKGSSNSKICVDCGAVMHADCALSCKCGNALCDSCYTKGRGICKDCKTVDITKFSFDTIRRSNIVLYETCPWAFYLQVIKQNHFPNTIYTHSGIDLHDLFDKYCYFAPGSFSAQDILEEFKPLWLAYPESYYYGKITKEKIWERVIRNVDGFIKVHATLPAPFVTEEKIFLPMGEDLPTVNITMDRIDEDGEGLIVSDWKTGATMVGKKLAEDLQAPLYILAVQHHFKRPVNKFIFYYLGEGKTRVFTRIDDDKFVCKVLKREYIISLQETDRRVKKVFARIKAGNFQIPNEMKSYTCTNCHLSKSGLCEGKTMEIWNNSKRGSVWE